jgi:hypothetical protein
MHSGLRGVISTNWVLTSRNFNFASGARPKPVVPPQTQNKIPPLGTNIPQRFKKLFYYGLTQEPMMDHY